MRWSVVALVVLLAGCTGSPVQDVREAAALEVRAPVSDVDGNEEIDDGVDEAESPVPGVLVASLTASALNGSAPLSVNFTVAALNLTGAAINWTLDITVASMVLNESLMPAADYSNASAAYNGSTLPANVTHNFSVPGVFNITLLVVQAGSNSSVTLQVNVSAASQAPPGPPPIIQTVVGAWDAGLPSVCAASWPNPWHAAWSSTHEVLLYIANVDPATHGLPFTAKYGANGPGQQSVVLWFNGSTNNVLGSFTSTANPGSIEGIVPAGAMKVSFATCGPVGNSVTYTV